jgi:lysophospholipase L1-like esterase
MVFLRVLVVCVMMSAGLSAADAVKIVCVGDSITFGDKIEKGQDTYPQALEKLFNGAATVTNAGHNGASATKTADLPYGNTREFAAAKDAGAAVVVIMLGSNDSRQKDWAKTKAEYPQDLKDLVETFARLPQKPQVWLCLPPPAYSKRYGVRPEVIRDDIGPMVKQVASDEHIGTIDVFAALSRHPEWFADGIHPNAAGAQVLAKTVFAALTDTKAR